MATVMSELSSDFLKYLAEQGCDPGARLPAIPELATHLGISTGKLREQLEVARALGLVEVRPKTGMRSLAYDFAASIRTSFQFALALDRSLFESFGVLRNRLEAAFWHDAVALLEQEDEDHLDDLIERAWSKLRGETIKIPHEEHRDLHLTIFSRLENPFVRGILELYWEGYEAVGLNVYADYSYLERVWKYHEAMVQAIHDEDADAGHRALVEHTRLLTYPTRREARHPDVSAVGAILDENGAEERETR